MRCFLGLLRCVILVGCFGTAWGWTTLAPIMADDDLAMVVQKRDAAFKKLDTDSSNQLSEQEYLQRQGQSDALRRDFKLFDANANGSLSRSEFDSIPGFGKPFQRGDLPDPFEGLLGQAVAAMDEAYEGWDQNPEQLMNSTFFAINFAASLATDNRRRLDREIVSQADPNGDHMVTREEARRFLEIQLGIRWATGDRLRLGNGRVVNFARFLAMDANADNVISKKEFEENWWSADTAAKDFRSINKDGDGKVTLKEFSDPQGPNIVDPVMAFRKADTNMDALLDEQELLESTSTYRRKNLVSSSLSGFDEDGDGKLSLLEYRLSMLGNYNYAWASIPKDENSDDLLSFEEFVFDSKRNLFQLQRRLYFHKLDKDEDKKLSPAEFEFKSKPVHSLVLISLLTGESKTLFSEKEFPSCGSPAVSPDNKWIAFDAFSAEGISKSRVMKMDFDGNRVQDLCDGLMPTWSLDGKKFACSRYEGGSGVWIMNADGSADKRISDGWAAQWSPDGKSIAFTNDNSLQVYDVASGKTRVVLAKNSHPYQYIFWNMCWSPDSQRMVFKGRLPDKQEIAIVNMTGEAKLKTYHSSDKQIAGDLAWSPDGKRILFNLFSPEKKLSLMYQFSPDSDDPVKLVEGISTDQPWVSGCFSPDGKWLVLSSPE